jgi:hypothetical protein
MKMSGKRWFGGVAGACVFLAASVASAADPSISLGASENVTLTDGEHAGFYPSVMAGLGFEAGPVVIVPALGVEGCAELGRWGFLGAVVVDVPVHDYVGIDVAAQIAHDQEGDDWDGAVFAVGGGVGASFYLDPWSISPMVSLLGVPGEPGLFISPSISVGYTFDLSSDPATPPAGPAIGSRQ